MMSAFDELVNRNVGELCLAIGAGTFRDAVSKLIHDTRNDAYKRGYAAAQAEAENTAGDQRPAPAQERAPQAQRQPQQSNGQQRGDVPKCPRNCGSDMWDNRAKKASGEYAANRPDFSCKKKGSDPDCKGAIWMDNKGPQAADHARDLQRPDVQRQPTPDPYDEQELFPDEAPANSYGTV